MAVVSVLLGGTAFEGLPKMLTSIDSETRTEVLDNMGCHLKKYFLRESVNWMTENWKFLESQTLDIVKYIEKTPVDKIG